MIRVAIIGATGIVGQQFLVGLDGHPWFKVTKLAASQRSAGKKYIDALRDDAGSLKWWCPEPIPAGVAEMVVEYLKTADRENERTVTFDSKESNQSVENQAERAA